MTENINKIMSYANIINKVIKINHTLKQFIIDVHICNSLIYTYSTVYKYSGIFMELCMYTFIIH